MHSLRDRSALIAVVTVPVQLPGQKGAGGELDPLTIGVVERESGRMEELSRNDRTGPPHLTAELVIDCVPDDWMADKRKVDPDLVGPAGDRFRREERSVPESLIDLELGF